MGMKVQIFHTKNKIKVAVLRFDWVKMLLLFNTKDTKSFQKTYKWYGIFL